jgi:hypothetical protein
VRAHPRECADADGDGEDVLAAPEKMPDGEEIGVASSFFSDVGQPVSLCFHGNALSTETGKRAVPFHAGILRHIRRIVKLRGAELV